MRVALTALHGVGGAVAVETLRRAGFGAVHAVGAQFAPDPDFPTVAFPNPEEPGATDDLLTLAAEVRADVAIALDPDADRCAAGIPKRVRMANAVWRRNRLAVRRLHPVANRRSSGGRGGQQRGLPPGCWPKIAAHYGATHVETLTGFKWLARADSNVPGRTLVYAYEEAIGHCVDPAAVRDKDGISAAVLVADLVATLKDQGRSVSDMLNELARRYGVHDVAAVSRRVASLDEATEIMQAAAGRAAERAGRDSPATPHRYQRCADLYRR